jgi:hypothetical protein
MDSVQLRQLYNLKPSRSPICERFCPITLGHLGSFNSNYPIEPCCSIICLASSDTAIYTWPPPQEPRKLSTGMLSQSRCLHLRNRLSLDTLPRTIRDRVAARIKSVQSKFPRFQPQLAIIQAGSREDSTTYIRMKRKAAEEVGIKTTFVHIPADVSVSDALETVRKLNDDEQVNGILVQLPLGDINSDGERVVTEAISPEKDVDG